MTWVCTADAWTCPNCAATWTRTTQSEAAWLTDVRRVQAAHGQRCTGPRPTPHPKQRTKR